MNLYLHNIGAESEDSPIEVNDSLITSPGAKYDMVLTNPPFGKKSSVTYVTDDSDTKRENQTIRFRLNLQLTILSRDRNRNLVFRL